MSSVIPSGYEIAGNFRSHYASILFRRQFTTSEPSEVKLGENFPQFRTTELYSALKKISFSTFTEFFKIYIY
jgi:hypothetical protein